MINKKHKAGSIATNDLAKKVEQKLMSNSGVPTAETDRDLLRLGLRSDGSPQMTNDKPKKERFKSNDTDLGKYMSHGYSTQTDLSKLLGGKNK